MTTIPKNNSGYLELFIGPMFSGKTSEILKIYKKCIFLSISVVVINHNIDTRYSSTTELSTHDNQMIPCTSTTNLLDIWELWKNEKTENIYDVVLINEGQFFDDLCPFVNNLLNYKKKIYVCGLDGDHKRNKFGQILELIPLCDKITKLTSYCNFCKDGTTGIFSLRLTDEKEQVVVGSSNYVSVCRNCYDTKTQQK
jgi:thymidine kinase